MVGYYKLALISYMHAKKIAYSSSPPCKTLYLATYKQIENDYYKDGCIISNGTHPLH